MLDNRGRVVGVVSQADLLPKQVLGGHRPTRREQLLHLEEIEKADATVAGDLVTAPAVTIDPDAGLGAAARRMAQHRVKQLPVVARDGSLVGVVSRGDLLKVFLREDEQLFAEVRHELLEHVPSIDVRSIGITVAEGVVALDGQVEHAAVIPVAPGWPPASKVLSPSSAGCAPPPSTAPDDRPARGPRGPAAGRPVGAGPD